MTRRLSICYAAPGQNLVPWAGPTRNVLSAAEALAEWADVTVAFRCVPELAGSGSYRVLAIEDRRSHPSAPFDDNATRGLRPLNHLAYCRTVWSFGRQLAGRFDIVLEKGWRLSGLLSVAAQRAGVPAIVVENDVRYWTEPLGDPRQLAKYALHQAAEAVAAECSRRASRVVAETEDLKQLLASRRGVAPDRIDVIGLGVDHTLFAPRDQASARGALDVPADAFVMLYVGAMDEYHDLRPVIEALADTAAPVELHIVGDGEYRPAYEEQAAAAPIRARFHGRVPHDRVPEYIAAADLCIAPYRTDAFRGGRMPFSTLKIPEYMACARPVVSVPSDGVCRLVEHGVSGFLVPNDTAAWRALLAALPSRERLAAMGTAAAVAARPVTWRTTASRYLETCEQVLSRRPGFQAPLADPAGLTR
jgi:glycosyltransferase involved in cell wall biosynthesis